MVSNGGGNRERVPASCPSPFCRQLPFAANPHSERARPDSREKSGFRRIEKIHFVGALVLRDFAGVDAQPSAWLVRRSEGRKAANQPQKATTYFRKLAEMTKDADTDRVEISEARASLTQ